MNPIRQTHTSIWRACGCAVLAAALAAAGMAQAATYYVDVNYDGANGASDGTSTKPWTTLQAAATTFAAGSGHVILVANGEYKRVSEGGSEDFGTGGYNLSGKPGSWRGGYIGQVSGATFDWTTRTLPNATTILPASVTVISLTNANSRAFYSSGYEYGLNFEGFVFRDSNVSQASYDGGAIFLNGGYGAGSWLRDCVFINNRTTRDGGAVMIQGRNGVSQNLVFIDNYAGGKGGGLATIFGHDKGLSINNAIFLGNQANGGGGGIFQQTGGTLSIALGRFERNVANTVGGGGIYIGRPGGATIITRSTFVNNAAPGGSAGAVGGTEYEGTLLTLENCLVVSNTAVNYAVVARASFGPASATLRHTTVADNTGGGVYAQADGAGQNAGFSIRNSIIANNGATGLSTDATTPTNTHNDVYGHTTANYGGTAAAGTGCISLDATFAGSGDYRLAQGSPCVDTGADLGITADLNGVVRPMRFGTDMGCYEEWQIPIIANRVPVATATNAEVRAEFTYESVDIVTYAYFAIDTSDQGTNSLAGWSQSAGVGEKTQGVIFGASFFSLEENTTYWYRCVSSNSYDVFWGPAASFKTPAAGGATRLWTGLGGNALASNTNNWQEGLSPAADDYVLLDSSPSNMTWDAGVNGLPDSVARWTQTEKYTGTVTLTGPRTVSGNTMAVNGGTLQTAQNTAGGITVAGELAIGPQGTVLVRRSSTTAQDVWGTVVGAGQTIAAATLTVDGLLSADAQGFTEGQGPAPGTENRGGSHGGEGAGTSLSTYGSVTNPTALGSGGRSGWGATPGGGAIVLSVTDHVTVNGVIGVDASHIGGSDRRGAGGSINITTATLSGTGTIRANGGNGYLGGGGGRVAIVLTSGNDVGDVAIRAFGGTASGDGAAGTVYLKHTGHSGLGTVIVDNNNRLAFGALTQQRFTRLSGGGDVVADYAGIVLRNQGNLGIRSGDTLDFTAATISGSGPAQATLSISGTNGLTFPPSFTLATDYTLCVDVPLTHAGGHWIVPAGAVLSHNRNFNAETHRLQLSLANLTVAEFGAINLNERGYIAAGPGAGNENRGASYGGGGGTATLATSTAFTYGSILNPVNLGSNSRERSGGGAVILSVDNALVVDGTISANGRNFNDRLGSGGTVNIVAGTVSGGGKIRASGGDGYMGGGGGRVAVKLNAGNNFGSLTFEAYGGVGDAVERRAAAGTIYRQTAAEGDGFGTVLIDNRNQIPTSNAFAALPGFAASVEDVSKTRWVAQSAGKIGLLTHAAVESLTLGAGSYLELAGKTLTLWSLSITNRNFGAGSYSAAVLGPLVTDSSGGAGLVIIKPRGTMLLLR